MRRFYCPFVWLVCGRSPAGVNRKGRQPIAPINQDYLLSYWFSRCCPFKAAEEAGISLAFSINIPDQDDADRVDTGRAHTMHALGCPLFGDLGEVVGLFPPLHFDSSVQSWTAQSGRYETLPSGLSSAVHPLHTVWGILEDLKRKHLDSIRKTRGKLARAKTGGDSAIYSYLILSFFSFLFFFFSFP